MDWKITLRMKHKRENGWNLCKMNGLKNYFTDETEMLKWLKFMQIMNEMRNYFTDETQTLKWLKFMQIMNGLENYSTDETQKIKIVEIYAKWMDWEIT